MEPFFIYLLKSAGIIFLFTICYQFFLKKETFFNMNRGYLLLGIIASIGVPLINITKTVIVEYSAVNFDPTHKNLVDFVEANNHNYGLTVLGIVYIIGALFMTAKFSIQLFSLRKLIVKGKHTKSNGIIMVETTKKVSPFSFFNYIVYKPEKYSTKELQTILDHEKIHVAQKHSIDIVLVSSLLIFQWCNPFLWWYKNLIQQNLEFITDKETTATGIHKKEYQYLLLKTNSNLHGFGFTNPFFNSLIKKRIIMLNKKQSNQRNLIKYTAILPILMGFVVLFNIKTIAQIKAKPLNNINTENLLDNIDIKNPLYIVNGTELTELPKFFKKESIETINVYKDQSAIKKYGEKGKNGVVVIALKDGVTFKVGENLLKSGIIENYLINERKGKNPLILIDGKVSTQQKAITLDKEDKIESLRTIIGKDATKKYGAKAKDGYVEITTKK